MNKSISTQNKQKSIQTIKIHNYHIATNLMNINKEKTTYEDTSTCPHKKGTEHDKHLKK